MRTVQINTRCSYPGRLVSPLQRIQRLSDYGAGQFELKASASRAIARLWSRSRRRDLQVGGAVVKIPSDSAVAGLSPMYATCRPSTGKCRLPHLAAPTQSLGISTVYHWLVRAVAYVAVGDQT
jgi:hypothetical protein